ncbi:ZIP zinc transporter-domain-containing protein [Emericellopsis atlantica]|uniref:ZIP zinc transporter-domain-containing protein n=1 Tax=Emericellopsis atlantica TaxID=2614577 RepID=A0A9P7ZUK6_9HYPO|nr:ZIP zinc transporter-domain-containing protein [Emericellopsis atlantica]KAG9258142.1 ZIP zinc transporter-domain-containing protein [Emericellopsis atlantica]
MADNAWANVPTDLLRAELQRRHGAGDQADESERPTCGSRDRGHYDVPAHVAALFLILALSTLCCALPLLSRRSTSGRKRSSIIFYCQHLGSGVLLATAFVHLLPMAFESLTDPCLPYFFSEGYTPLPGFVAMISAIVVTGVESFLTARGAGHSHTHSHDFWDGSDNESTTHIPMQEPVSGLAAARRDGHRPNDLSLGDEESTQGLVAGVSPLPTSTPIGQRDGQKPDEQDDFNDDESDLDFEADELHRPSPSERNEETANLTRRNHQVDKSTAPQQSQEEQNRQVLQCVMLEAGILFHSIFIGMAISVATGPAFVVFLIAISFHQSFEGLALGSRIAAIQFPKGSLRPWLMVLAYGTTTPIGQAIGLGLNGVYDPASAPGLLLVGFMNAISAGLLLYAGLVQLLAEDFLSEKSFKTLKGTKRARAFGATTAPTQQWADSPMRLVHTPQYEMKKTDLFTTGATHMGLLHNAIIRGYNSIYLQAPHVQESDKADFVNYALTWYRFVKSHHDDEELNLFSRVEEILNDKQVFAETHDEHETFLGGLAEFNLYLSTLESPDDLSATKLLAIMDSFQQPFEHHFHHEITTIAALADHPNAPTPDSPDAAVASALFKAWGKKTVSKAGMSDVLPFFLMNLDATFEDGMWSNWPPMPAPIRWALTNVVGALHGPWWRFASCDSTGQPRELHALQTKSEKTEL